MPLRAMRVPRKLPKPACQRSSKVGWSRVSNQRSEGRSYSYLNPIRCVWLGADVFHTFCGVSKIGTKTDEGANFFSGLKFDIAGEMCGPSHRSAHARGTAGEPTLRSSTREIASARISTVSTPSSITKW